MAEVVNEWMSGGGGESRFKGSPCLRDVSQCFVNNEGCEQNCSNTNKNYVCSCEAGYEPSFDQHSCTGKRYVTGAWQSCTTFL